MGSKSMPFGAFLTEFNKIFSQDLTFQTFWDVSINLIKGVGAPIAYGYFLWAIVAGAVGYFLAYRMAQYWKNRKRGK